MLVAEDLHVSYGPVDAVHGVTFEVPAGRVVGIIGPNGAGKTSILNAVSGLVPAIGEVRFEGEPIAHLRPWDRAARGIAHVPQGRRVFAALSVKENLQVGVAGRVVRAEMDRRLDSVFSVFPRLGERRSQRAGQLSGGEQQMLAVGRGLMGAPKILMLDEPTLGLAPVLVDTMLEHLSALHKLGMTILLVEQRVAETLEFCDEAYVLEQGAITLYGPASELIGRSDIRESYLGV